MIVPHHNKGFINLQFLQELCCQKRYWDQARLSSVEKKQVVAQWRSLFCLRSFLVVILQSAGPSLSPVSLFWCAAISCQNFASV